MPTSQAGDGLYEGGTYGHSAGFLEHAANATTFAVASSTIASGVVAASAASSPLLSAAWHQLVAQPVALLLGKLLAEDSSFRVGVMEMLAPAPAQAHAPTKAPVLPSHQGVKSAVDGRSTDLTTRQQLLPVSQQSTSPRFAAPRLAPLRRPGRALKGGGGGGGGGESDHPEAE